MLNIHLTFERWKYNPEREVYVSTEGRIKDKNKKFLEPVPFYNYMRIKANGKLLLVHRLVMETWRPNHNKRDSTVDHINMNTRDNRLCNLRWMRSCENETQAQEKTRNLVASLIQKETVRALYKELHSKRQLRATHVHTGESVKLLLDSMVKYISNEVGQDEFSIESDLIAFLNSNKKQLKKYGFIIKCC